jgi:hypothetical protein
MGNVIPAHALARKAKEVHVLMFGRFIINIILKSDQDQLILEQ